MALHATTIRFGDRGYTAIAHAADAQGISVSQYVREAALIRAVLDELAPEAALPPPPALLATPRGVRRLAQAAPPGPPPHRLAAEVLLGQPAAPFDPQQI